MLLRDRYPVTAAFEGIPISNEDTDEDAEFRFGKRTRDFSGISSQTSFPTDFTFDTPKF